MVWWFWWGGFELRGIGLGAADLLATTNFRGDGNSHVSSDKTDAIFEVLGDGDADRPDDCFAGLGLVGFDGVAGVGGRVVDFVAARNPAVIASLGSSTEIIG